MPISYLLIASRSVPRGVQDTSHPHNWRRRPCTANATRHPPLPHGGVGFCKGGGAAAARAAPRRQEYTRGQRWPRGGAAVLKNTIQPSSLNGAAMSTEPPAAARRLSAASAAPAGRVCLFCVTCTRCAPKRHAHTPRGLGGSGGTTASLTVTDSAVWVPPTAPPPHHRPCFSRRRPPLPPRRRPPPCSTGMVANDAEGAPSHTEGWVPAAAASKGCGVRL